MEFYSPSPDRKTTAALQQLQKTQLCEADIFSVQIYQAVEIAQKSIVRPRPWPQLGATLVGTCEETMPKLA